MDGELQVAAGDVDESIVLTPIAQPAVLMPPTAALPKVYSAPRRFDLATVFVVTTAYSVMFTSLRLLNCDPIAMAYITAFISIVGVSQPLIFGGVNPRGASIIGGMLAAFLLMVGTLVVSVLLTHSPELSAGIGSYILLATVYAIFFGGPFGYIAGTLVGSVFLVADVLRQRFGRASEQESATGG